MGRQVHRFVLAGDRFGDWEVLDVNVPRNKYNRLMARCACRRCGGEPRLVLQYDLLRGASTGDGCLKHQKLYDTRVIHASAPRGARSKTWTAWRDAKRRYGPEQMLAEWFNSFEAFVRDVGEKPSPNHRLNVQRGMPLLLGTASWVLKRGSTVNKSINRDRRRAEARASTAI